MFIYFQITIFGEYVVLYPRLEYDAQLSLFQVRSVVTINYCNEVVVTLSLIDGARDVGCTHNCIGRNTFHTKTNFGTTHTRTNSVITFTLFPRTTAPRPCRLPLFKPPSTPLPGG